MQKYRQDTTVTELDKNSTLVNQKLGLNQK